MSAPVRSQTSVLEGQVLQIVRELLLEQEKTHAAERLTAHSSFVRDLGLASLDLVELLVRCEARLDVELPDEIAEQADTPAGWVRAILQGAQGSAAKSVYRIVPPSTDPPPEPASARNLAEVLRWHAEKAPGRVHIHLLEEGSGRGVTCGQLLDAAETVARGLISSGLRPNETVAILLPNSARFLEAFFGVMLAGGIPVPVYPPASASRIADYVERQAGILRGAGARFLISFDRVKPVARILRARLPGLAGVTTVEALRELGGRTSARLPGPAETALVQYTSGSVAEPKGVVLTHAGILANVRAIGKALRVRPGDAVVSWLPLASDMGLVGCWLFSLYYGTPLTLLSPLEFLDRPESWLWAIHDSRGTLSAAPNFAYELCVRRIPMWTLEGIDLSCWRTAVNAGEPVLAGTVERFTHRFRVTGFRAESMLPCYGLAEASVALAIPPVERAPLADQDGFFSVGPPIEGFEVRIVDENGRDLPDGASGRLLFRGPSRCNEYLGSTGGEEWVDSGDLACRRNDELYITGRVKEVIIRAGRNLVPYGIETAVSEVAGVRGGCVAALGLSDPAAGTERLVVVAESPASSEQDITRVTAGVARAVTDAIGTAPDEVRLIPPGTLPKTANGKIRRSEIRNLYLGGKLGGTEGPAWTQMAGLWWRNFAGLAWTAARHLAAAARRGVLGAAAQITAVAFGCMIRLTGRASSLVAPGARLALWILGKRMKAEGDAIRGPAIVVSNRCSRLDPLCLAALVSGPVLFSGEEALRGLPGWAAFLIRPAVAASDGRIGAALRAGSAILLLPDSPVGTPAARCRYRLAALHGAIAADAPVIPVAIEELRGRAVSRIAEPVRVSPQDTARGLRQKVRQALSEAYA